MDEPSDSHSSANGLYKKIDREKGFRKAAEFILLLNKDQVSRILAQLTPEEVEGIAREIVDIKKMEPSDVKKVLAEYGLSSAPNFEKANNVTGGMETAARMLKTALGEERSRAIIAKIEKRLPADSFAFLKEFDHDKIYQLLSGESPQIIALALAMIEPPAASVIMEKLSPEVAKEVAQRLAKMDKVLPDVIRRTADLLKKKMFMQSEISTNLIDGKSALRRILQNMDFSQEQKILDSLAEEKPGLAQELENELYTMEMFKKLAKKDLEKFFRDIVDRDIALMLKGEAPDINELILSAVSERRRSMVLEESEYIGELPKKEVEKVQRLILERLKVTLGTGEMTLADDDNIVI